MALWGSRPGCRVGGRQLKTQNSKLKTPKPLRAGRSAQGRRGGKSEIRNPKSEIKPLRFVSSR